MKSLYYFFFFFVAVFVAIQLLRHYEMDLPSWIYYYLSDFLCMPVVFTICLKVVHFITGDASIKIGLFPILVLTLLYSIYFEIFLPQINARYTADVLDVGMYFSGSLLFYFLQESSFTKTSKTNKAA